MHPRDAGTAMGSRIAPTDDDLPILQRNMKRLMRWDNEIHGEPLSDRPVLSRSNLLPAIRRACGDYLHFKPE